MKPHIRTRIRQISITIFKIIVCIFAVIGFVLVAVYAAVELGWTRTSGIIDNQHNYFKNLNSSATSTINSTSSIEVDSQAWINSPQWQVLKVAITKDQASIDLAASSSGIPARMIITPLVVEQLRLFYSDREVFKEVFAPLKILGDQSQFSWGVMGIKQDTAIEIENNLESSTSPWYLGPAHAHILDYTAANLTTTSTSTDTNTERFYRLTDENNRYYSYLYAALMIKELEIQWQKAGFPINNRPDIVATLFNIGFEGSHPNGTPQVGGAEINIGSSTYSFGGLAGSFYESGELEGVFPK